MKRLAMVFLCLALALGAAGCSLRLEKAEPVSRETERLPAPLPQPDPQPEPQPEPEPEPEPTPEQLRLLRARELLADMTLEQTVGQLFFARCPAADGAALMERCQPGGYLLFKRDVQDSAGGWLTGEAFTARLEEYRRAAAVAPFFGVDEEGGTVTRASQNPNLFPGGKCLSPQKLYAQGGLEAISKDAQYKSEILLQYGINVNFAPVADVTTDPGDFMYDRAFGGDAAATADYVRTVVAAMDSCGMGAVLKHFPGYGNNRDTHTAAVVDNRPREQFTESDLLPFSAGMEWDNAAVLVSHNIVTCMDESLPASLSPAVYRVLREELGFAGVALTDDLAMDAVADYAAGGQAAVLALQAGADMVVSSDLERDLDRVLQAVAEGSLSRDRVEEAALRVLQWKLRLGVLR